MKKDVVLINTARGNEIAMTAHSAFNTREAVQRLIDTTVENIEAFAAGEPKNTVSRRNE